MIVPPVGPGNRRCGGHGAPATPRALPCSSLPMAGGTSSKLLFSGQEKALSSLLKAAHEPSHDHRSPPSQLLSLPQLPQRLMLRDKGNCSQPVPLLSLPFHTSIKLLCKCHPKARLQEQLKCTAVKGAGAGRGAVTPLSAPHGAPLLLSLQEH